MENHCWRISFNCNATGISFRQIEDRLANIKKHIEDLQEQIVRLYVETKPDKNEFIVSFGQLFDDLKEELFKFPEL